MKKYICILAGAAALFVGCEQKTETVAPAASPSGSTTESTTTTTTSSPAATP